jgi:hypothetical protein
VNITNASGLNLKAYAYDLNKNYNPPSDRFYVDPARGKYILPGPTYWSKLETFQNIIDPEYCSYAPVYEKSGTFRDATYNYTTEYMRVKTGKFGNGISVGQYSSAGNYDGYYYIYPSGKIQRNWSKGVISGWFNPDTFGYSTSSDRYVYHEMYMHWLLNLVYCETFRHDNDYIWARVYLTIPGQTSVYFSLSTSAIFNHIYIVWDTAKSLSGGESIAIYVNGTKVLSSTANLPDMNSYIMTQLLRARMFVSGSGGGSINASIIVDNLKIWDTLVNTSPDWEYNSTFGREGAMLPIYGASYGYKPRIDDSNDPHGGVGYYKGGSYGNYATITF